MVNLKVTYQPFTKAFAPGYHGKTVRTMVRQWVVTITNPLPRQTAPGVVVSTVVTSTWLSKRHHGTAHGTKGHGR